MTTRHRFFCVGVADRSGNSWTEVTLMDPKMTLERLRELRAKNDGRTYYVYDPDNEERGDIESYLEELVKGANG